MFGPDKCGDTNKVHFIFNHKHPITGALEEKHLQSAPAVKTDKVNHLYTLIIRPNQTYAVLIDDKIEKEGSLFEDFLPPVNPPKEIDDPTDNKPADWVEDEMIDDPDSTKPDDWDDDQPEYVPDPSKLDPPDDWYVDEPRFVPDPDAKRPDDWDEDIHGEWEAPTIANPKCEQAAGCGEYDPPLVENPNYQGKWSPPQIPNPAYQGAWKARQIPNPDFYEDPDPFTSFPPIVGAGFELWMVNKDIGFANVYVGQDEALVREWNEAHFRPKLKAQEWEAKKIEEVDKSEGVEVKITPTPGPNPLHRGGGALLDFWLNVKESVVLLYEDNPAVVTAMGIGVVVLPIAVVSFACSGSGEAPPRKLTPEELKAKKARRAQIRKRKAEKAAAAAAAAGTTGEEGQGTTAKEDDAAHRTATQAKED
jgi:calnexin